MAVTSVDSTAGYGQVLVRVESSPNVQSANTTFSGRIVDVSNANVLDIMFYQIMRMSNCWYII